MSSKLGRRHRAGIAAVVASVGLLAACSSGESAVNTQGQSVSSTATAGSADDLRGVCPATVTIQTNWWPQAEYGALYRLLGGTLSEDVDHKKVTGELTSADVDTGVKLQLASGGPANSYTPGAKVLYLDNSVTLAGVDLDQAVQLSSGSQPVQGVFAPMEKSPVVILWDPAALPGVHSINDLGKTGTKVLYFSGSTYMDYLVGSGILNKAQVDSSYDGTPSEFVAQDGKIAQQGYLTNEVYQYEHELPQWNKKVGWQLVDDLGYPNYPETLAIRPDRKAALSGCLKKLVPMLQRAAVSYLNDPAPTNQLITKLVKDFNAYPYSMARAGNAVTVMKQNQIMGNGSNGAVGSFDPTRVERVIQIDQPIYARNGIIVPGNLNPDSVATDEFIDPTIKVK